ncbi:MAG TPA: MBL fold metallo-hydrolase [bacterium]|nr:MBL fold metallo-hydrolase [bacterium]
MKITYIGHSCFKIEMDGKTIIIDPYNPSLMGYDFPKISADILLLSHKDPETTYLEGVTNYEHLIDSPGEYEISEIFIYGLSTFHDAEKGVKHGKNTAFLIEDSNFSVLHLGSLGHELPKETLEKIGDVDVLMIPVGGNYVIDAEKASKVISSLEPGIVIPMHYATKDSKHPEKLAELDEFLEEMGVEKGITKRDNLELKSSVSEEETKVIVLKPSH